MNLRLAAAQTANILENANLPSGAKIIRLLLQEMADKDALISDLTLALGKALANQQKEYTP